MTRRNDKHQATREGRSAVGSRGLAVWIASIAPPALLIVAGIIAYANSFDGVFLYDDIHHILEDERIRQFWPPNLWWHHRRPVVVASLAMNHTLGGFDPWGYHLFNLTVHLLAGLTLFGLTRRTLVLVGFGASGTKSSREVSQHSPVSQQSALSRQSDALASPLTKGGSRGVLRSTRNLPQPLLVKEGGKRTKDSVGPDDHEPFAGSRRLPARRDFIPPAARGGVGISSEHSAARWVALTVALLWLVHPLQTQSVTYVIQRGESLMGLFYLFTLYAVVRGATSERGRSLWYISAAVACALGMGSKAVMLTAPVAVLLIDRAYLSGSIRESLRRRWGLYVGLVASWGVLLLTGVVQGTIAPRQADAVMGFGYEGATPWTYLLTQAAVIPHYLRLVFWPDALCLDYAWPFVHSVGEVAIPGALMVTLFIATVWAVIKKPRLGTPGALFFLILGPTSSVVPIQDPAYEHRMYLSLAAVIVLIVLGGRVALGRLFDRINVGVRGRMIVTVLLAGATTAALGARTISRNRVYASDLAMWSNVVANRPDNARAHYNLGNALRTRNDLPGARASYERAVELNPKLVMAQNNLGNILRLSGDPESALVHLRRAVDNDPEFAEGYVNLGAALADLKQPEEAIVALRRACVLDATSAEAHFNLGMSLGSLGQFDEAIEAFEASAQLMEVAARDPETLGQAYYFLGITQARVGRSEEAATALTRAVSIDPNNERARAALDGLP